MSRSLVKYAEESKDRDGQKLFWQGATRGELPFRGPQPPMLTEEEFETHVVRVADMRNGWFDMDKDEERKSYLQIIERCLNGWYRLIHLERFFQRKNKHYVEWAEYYLEDGRRTPYLSPGVMELAHGQQPQGLPGLGHQAGA